MIISFAGYDFLDSKACLVCRHVIEGNPILAFFHDDDGDLHFSCGRDAHLEGDWLVVDIEDVITRHSDLYELPTVRMGEIAERNARGEEWMIFRGT